MKYKVREHITRYREVNEVEIEADNEEHAKLIYEKYYQSRFQKEGVWNVVHSDIIDNGIVTENITTKWVENENGKGWRQEA